MKEAITIIAIALTIISYVKYIIDIFKGKTKPHIFSWLAWSTLTYILFFIQLQAGGGVGAFVTLNTAIVCTIVTVASIKKGEKNITRTDVVAFIGAMVSMVIWLFIKQPFLSVVVICVIDILSFIPTFRKSWYKPQEETLSTWVLNTFRHMLAMLAMESYTATTLFSPIYLVLANGIFSIMLIFRRKTTKL